MPAVSPLIAQGSSALQLARQRLLLAAEGTQSESGDNLYQSFARATSLLPIDTPTPSNNHHTTATMSARFATMSARFAGRQNAFSAQMRRSYQSAAENKANIEAPPAGKLAQIWNSPVGPKTVHFWAPIMKVRLDMSF